MENQGDMDGKRETIENLKLQYEKRMRMFKNVSILLFCICIGLGVLAGISFTISSNAFGDFSSNNFMRFGTIAGLSVFGAFGCFFLGFILLVHSKQNNLVLFIKQRLRQMDLENPEKLYHAINDKYGNGDSIPRDPVKEKVIVKEIVKVRCKYCNTLVDVSESICPECGASL
ncbi:hypothetical protein GF325_04535 [Candidatus Bathyarchaeota archaeon]|nr:hypothetical protein [Candidatus Bathyarchaeota archaeon]